MHVSATLSGYIGRHFLAAFLGVFMVFLCLIFVFDAIELLRRAASKPDISFGAVIEMSVLKLPHMGQKTFPFAVLFGAMAAFWRLTRSHELVVARAAGVSAWQFLFPVILIALLLGVFQVALFNPLASMMLSRYAVIEALHFKGQESTLALSQSGLWLRQANRDGQSVVHAKRVSQNGRDVELNNVIIFRYSGLDNFAGRIDARRAALEDGFWHLFDAWTFVPEKAAKFEQEAWFETDLTLNRIQDSFAPPETMSFWELPKFIRTLEEAGFSSLRHRLHWHSLLAAPLLLCAMILIAATFTLRNSSRRGGATYVVSGGVLTGFILYFVSDVVFALGLSDSIPAVLAAWSPSGASTLLGVAMLLHLEDG